MRILFDECMPRLLNRALPNHSVTTVGKMGWSGTKNGALLNLAETQFDVLLTVDRNLQYQQHLLGRQIAVIVLIAKNTKIETLLPLMPQVLAALQTIQPGQVVQI